MPRVSDAFDVDREFDLDVDVTKAEERDGRRILRGVASGVLEDADGERVSRKAIVNMARQAVRGLKLVAGSHQQDWHNEMGDVVKVEHDPEHDELLVECELPPEGHDPFADKAWRQQTIEGKPLGFSIGGKCHKAFYELTDTGKKRRVLDEVGLRHVALTQKPSYRQSFALAVAKTRSDDEPAAPADDAFGREWQDEPAGRIVVEKVEKVDDDQVDVEKADSTIASTDQDTQGNKGTAGKDSGAPDVNGEDAKKDLPQGKGPRQLACPNCGHEFGAGMPADTDTPADEAGDTTGKRAASEEDDMGLDETVANLRKLAGTGDDVKKTEPETPVEKKDDEVSAPGADAIADVEKMIAASHDANQHTVAALVEKTSTGFGEVAKAIKGIHSLIAELPGGRQSIARVKAAQNGEGTPARLDPPAGDETVAKTATDDGDDVEKTINDLIEKRNRDQDPEGTVAGVEALKLLNERDFGIR